MKMSVNNISVLRAEYLLVSPDGKKLPIDARVFEAFRSFIEERKQGSVTVSFISGGIRGVRAETVYS